MLIAEDRQVSTSSTAASSSTGSSSQPSSYASATGKPSSYARVHGEVSRAPAQWRRIPSVAKEDLQDVKYEKDGEGIAKVLRA
jgi:naphthoate synthase